MVITALHWLLSYFVPNYSKIPTIQIVFIQTQFNKSKLSVMSMPFDRFLPIILLVEPLNSANEND